MRCHADKMLFLFVFWWLVSERGKKINIFFINADVDVNVD